jgi:hypothetical protein
MIVCSIGGLQKVAANPRVLKRLQSGVLILNPVHGIILLRLLFGNKSLTINKSMRYPDTKLSFYYKLN